MEHSSHAHPLPDGRDVYSNGSSGPPSASCTVQSRSAPVSRQLDELCSPQTRRLQLRNNGFRGPLLPFRRISPLLGASLDGIEPFTLSAVNNESSPSSAEKRTLYGEDLPQSPVNILQELNKISSKKRRASPRPGFGAIFEDNLGKEHNCETSWYNGGSNDCSPVAPVMTPTKRSHLREVSLNQRTTPPLSVPLAKHVKGRNMNNGKLRSTSSEIATYIEHLESELASAHAKLDLQPSPRTSKLRATKLRALNTENRNLKHENSEWQKNFESRVQEERAKRLDADIELRSSMRILEDEMEMKDARMAELEWDLESMRVRMRDLEGLESINHNLEKRIEALTNLLVQSPTKLELSSASTSPIRADPSKRTPRPRSMLSRLPPSPGGLRLSLATVSESSLGRSQSLGAAPDTAESPEVVSEQAPNGYDLQSPTSDEGRNSPHPTRQSEHFDRRSRASTSFRSAPSSASKHTSMRSIGSFGPISWGLSDQEEKSATKQRRMRRFPSGSKSLKPLVLPLTTDAPFQPTSAPISSTGGMTRQDIEDSTIVSLSPLDNEASREQPQFQRSATWAQEQTLKTLEGIFEGSNDVGCGITKLSQCDLAETEEECNMGFQAIPTDKRKTRSRPRSLRKELEEAAVKQGTEGLADADHPGSFEDSLIPVDPVQSLAVFGTSPSEPSLLAIHGQQSRQALETVDTDPTPRPNTKQRSVEFSTQGSPKANPSVALSQEPAHGIFSRLTNVIMETKQEPFVLARRLLVNAWSLGSRRLGGIGWWLLGLVYGTRWRKRKRKADTETAEDGLIRNFDWQHSSSESSRTRSAGDFPRDYGSTNNHAQGWISSPHISRGIPPVTQSSNPRTRPHPFPCGNCVEPNSRRTLRLWLQFSLTIILAIGVAIKHGPGALLESDNQRQARPIYEQAREREPLLQGQRRRAPNTSFNHLSDQNSQQSRDSHDTNLTDSGYGSITFAETLGPADFEYC